MKKYNRELVLEEFAQVFKWANEKRKSVDDPIFIKKYGGRSPYPFRLYIEGDAFVLRSNPQDTIQRSYNLTKSKWEAFCRYVSNNPDMTRGELANNYRMYGCTNKYFWPSIISISVQYNEQKSISK